MTGQTGAVVKATPKTGSNQTYKVLVTDAVSSAGISILETVATVDVKLNLSEEEICELIGQYDGLMVRSGTTVTEKIIRNGKKLKIIGRAGVGIDNVHIDSATDMGIFVVNSPLGNTVAAAEHTLCLLLAVARHVAPADASIRQGKWDRSKFMGTQLQGKILGIVGLGQVGSHVARVAREIGMKLICHDPYANEQKVSNLGATSMSLEELFSNADFITLHVPLLKHTKNMIRKETISLMKPTARIVNTSRGGVVNEADLCEALGEGRLGGAALDVFENEIAQTSESVLLNTANLLLTPHLGASTKEAQVNVAIDVAQQIRDAISGALPESAVNIPGLCSSDMEKAKLLLECCATLGQLSQQLLLGPLETLAVYVEGPQYALIKGEPLLLAVAQGSLSVFSSHRVNFVNARLLAEKQSIKLSITKETGHTKNAIRVEARSRTEEAIVKGTVTEERETLVTLFKGIPIYMIMPGASSVHLFYSLHQDVPGSLAEITQILYKGKINVAFCHLGRTSGKCEKRGGEKGGDKLAQIEDKRGLCVFHVDCLIPENVLEQIRALPHVLECRRCLSHHPH